MAACITRILELKGFDAKVKTKDIHVAFASTGEPFKCKWIDDHGVYLVFSDAVSAKRAFLQTLGGIAFQLPAAAGMSVTLVPYRGADSAAIVAYTHRGSRSDRANSVASQDPAAVLASGNVSPAVSMMIMAAAAASGGQPGNSLGGGINPAFNINQMYSYHNQFNGHSFPSPYSSMGSIPSSFSQGSLSDTFSYTNGLSTQLNGSLSASSSWSDFSTYNYMKGQGRAGSFTQQVHRVPEPRPSLGDISEHPLHPNIQEEGKLTEEDASSAITPTTNGSLREQQASITVNKDAAEPARSEETSDANPQTKLADEIPELPSSAAQGDAKIDELINATGSLSLSKDHGQGDVAASAGENVPNAVGKVTPPQRTMSPAKVSSPPRIGNPGKRMLGAALGVRHPGLPPRVIQGATPAAH